MYNNIIKVFLIKKTVTKPSKNKFKLNFKSSTTSNPKGRLENFLFELVV